MNEFEDSSNALNAFANSPVLGAADDLSRAFEIAGERIAASLEQAARRGELSFNSMASSIAQDLTRLVVSETIVDPITNALSGALSGALGGLGGGAGGSATTVNLNVSGVADSGGLAKSQGQITSAVSRAVSSGQRYR